MTAAYRPTEKYISNGFNVLLITHALFLIQIPKTFIGNCFQIENILFGQFKCCSDCKNTYTLISWLLFQCSPLKFAMQMSICLYLT